MLIVCIELDNSSSERNIFFAQRATADNISLTFKDLNIASGDKSILKNISGGVNSGHVLAIMGPSGAGKTSLLDLLAGRSTVSGFQLTGSISVNGKVLYHTQIHLLTLFPIYKKLRRYLFSKPFCFLTSSRATTTLFAALALTSRNSRIFFRNSRLLKQSLFRPRCDYQG